MRVLASPATSNRAGNPYNWLLYTHMQPLGVQVDEYSRARLLSGEYNIWHIHWPESLMNDPSLARAATSAARLFAMVAAAHRVGVRVVWTVHNIEGHESYHPRLSRTFLNAFASRVDGCINLTRAAEAIVIERFPCIARLPRFVVPHGHYRNAYPKAVDRKAARTQLALAPDSRVIGFVGQIRAYKNVPALIEAFECMDDASATLLIGGDPRPPYLAGAVGQAASRDPRVRLHLRFLPDDALEVDVKATDLLVFPSRQLNSGSVMLALSFDRPVLVPATGPILELQATVGAQWVLTYEGRLTGDVLRAALDRVTLPPLVGSPCLDSFEWPRLAAQTLDAYQQIIASRPTCLAAAHFGW